MPRQGLGTAGGATSRTAAVRAATMAAATMDQVAATPGAAPSFTTQQAMVTACPATTPQGLETMVTTILVFRAIATITTALAITEASNAAMHTSGCFVEAC